MKYTTEQKSVIIIICPSTVSSSYCFAHQKMLHAVVGQEVSEHLLQSSHQLHLQLLSQAVVFSSLLAAG